MAVRTLTKLKEDQGALLSAHRSRLTGNVAGEVLQLGGSPEGRPTVSVIAKVSTVVAGDPTYGPHLVVQIQEFSGTPPVASAASIADLRAYPTPGRVVGDYSVNEYVSLLTVRGALLAAKSA